MMLENKSIEKNKYVILGVVVFFALVFYTLNATKSGLWYDEAVEYFYSKYLTGTVPGGFGTMNMFERIRNTYQPPLYNVLMHFWLLIFDSEFAFRFIGIIITLIGSIGCFFAIEETLHDGLWSIIGMVFYLFTPVVVNYGLECAEYNLMLCFLSWTVYFFMRVLIRHDWKSIIGFFVFSCLSVYSQYGAVFIVVGMYTSILLFFLFRGLRLELKIFLISSAVTCTVAVIPLVVFFVIPQMSLQGSSAISHWPFFRYNFLIDFLVGGGITLYSLFGGKTAIGVIVLIILCFFSLFIQPKVIGVPFLSMVITWTLYFAAVCCSYYGYNSWNPTSVGFMNLGGRYALFLVPGIVVILTIGMGIVAKRIRDKNKKWYSVIVICAVLSFSVYCSLEMYRVSANGVSKDDIREVTLAWYECEGYNSKTLLSQWDDAIFHFYLIHDDRYDIKYDESIEVADIGSAEYDEMKDKLQGKGYLSNKDFYYITPNSGCSQTFLSVVKDAGYNIEKIYDGKSLLLYLTKQ